MAKEPGLEGRVRLMGFVGDADLVDLYRAAAAFVSASRDEGFNMPVLEAMASAVPTLCSDIPVHRELFEGAAAFFPADDEVALAGQLCQVLTDTSLRRQLVQSGLARAQHFSWNAAVQRVGAALEKICNV